MKQLELRQMFKNLSDCYADTGRFENDGSYSEGEVIQAITEDRFIEILKQAKLFAIPRVIKSEAAVCHNTKKHLCEGNDNTKYCAGCLYFY